MHDEYLGLGLLLSMLIVLFNIWDAVLTDKIIIKGGVEKAPIMRYIMLSDLTYEWRWSIKLGVVVVFLYICWTFSPPMWGYPAELVRNVFLAIFLVPFVWVVGHNTKVLRSMDE